MTQCVVLGAFLPGDASAQWVTRDQRWLLPRGPWNWAMSRALPEFYREQNGIAFGHAHLAETLLESQDAEKAEAARLEILDFIFSSPSVPPDEDQIAPTFTRLVWEVQKAFNWAHAFHGNLYDLFAADEVKDKESAYRKILETYLSKPEAITSHLLDHTGKLSSFPESRAFRDKFPKFTTQIWAYHWLQGGAYDVQLMGDAAKQRELLKRVIAHYHGYLRSPPVEWRFMPMIHEASPEFSRRFPEAAAIFDNLHMLHDNIDDVLVRPDLYPSLKDKREAILKILSIYLHRNHSSEDQYVAFHGHDMKKMATQPGVMAKMMPAGPRPPSAKEVLEGKHSSKEPDGSKHEGQKSSGGHK